jgi:hypothetical protein
MKSFALAAALVLASGAASHADGHQAPVPPPQPETIERQTMGGSFPLETVVTAVVIAIVAAALNTN